MVQLIGNGRQHDWHMEKIKCPECGYVQWAQVEHCFPWNSYVHECKKCDWIIMESDWGIPIIILPQGMTMDGKNPRPNLRPV